MGNNAFAEALAHDAKLSTGDVAVCVAWFLGAEDPRSPVSLEQIFKFIEGHGIRAALNRSRVRRDLSKNVSISIADPANVRVPLRLQTALRSEFGHFLMPEPLIIVDNILVINDFLTSRGYTQALARQVNGCYQTGMYDACAVMMRRLAEVLIIDAFEAKGLRDKIVSGGNYQMMGGLIGTLISSKDFKVTRNAPKWLDRLKELGDNAAHSRTYVTKALDIDDFKGAFRNLISELVSLSN